MQTKAVPSYEEHPVRRYFDLGIVVSLNTDNRLMSNTTLTEEYWLAHKRLGFTRREIDQMILYGFSSAFLPWADKQALIVQVKKQLEAIR